MTLATDRMLAQIDRCVAHQTAFRPWPTITAAWVELWVDSGDNGRRPLLSLKEDG